MNASQLPTIGAALAGGFYAGIIWLPTANIKYALIDAGKAGEVVGPWGEYGKRIDHCDSMWDA